MIYLDSALLSDARWASDQGFVSGITTNPRLMAAVEEPPLRHLALLLDALPGGTVCYQVTTAEPAGAAEEARAAWRQGLDRVIVKVPSLPALLPVVAQLQREGVPCMVTGVVAAGQVMAAAAAGAGWIAIYVERAQRASSEGADLVRQARALIDRWRAPTRIAAAGLVDVPQAVQAVLHGAELVTLPRPLIEQLPDHRLTATVTTEMIAALVASGKVDAAHHVVDRSSESR